MYLFQDYSLLHVLNRFFTGMEAQISVRFMRFLFNLMFLLLHQEEK